MSRTDTLPFELAVPDAPHRRIRGRLHGPSGFATARRRLPHVVLIHGFKGFMNWGFFPDIARRIAEREMIAVAFNMSGSGIGPDLETFSEPEAFAQNTISDELRDLQRVRRWIDEERAPGVDPESASLVGHSRGGAIALLHAADRAEIRSVVTWAAVASVDRFDADTKTMWREMGFLLLRNARTGQDQRIDLALLDDIERNRSRFDVESACRRLAVPTLLVHGGADETVPPGEMERLAASIPLARRQTLLVPGASHTFGISHPMTSRPAEAWETVARATLAMLERYR